MLLPQNMLILGVDAGSVLTALFVLFAIGSWLWSVISGQPNQVQGAKRPPGREQDLQSEINRFLNQVLKNQPPEAEDVPVLEEAEVQPQRPRRVARARPPQPQKIDNPVLAEEVQDRSRPGGKISRRKKPGSENLGSAVREHIAEHMQDRVAKQSQEHFAHGVAEKVKRDLGTFSRDLAAAGAPPTEKKPQNEAAQNVVAMLKNPATIKQAVIVNLILNRPRQGRQR